MQIKNTSQQNEIWLTVKEACELLGIAPPSIHKLVREGYLDAYRIEGLRGLKFKREDVLTLIKKVKPEELRPDEVEEEE